MTQQMHIVVEAVGAQLIELADKNAHGFHAATIADFQDFARRAEAACVDALFFADFIGKPREQFGRRPLISFEPITALAAIAASTESIGLVATASTTFNQPYNVARQLASLDQVSAGRAGWNAVTSIQGHGNFGQSELAGKTTRYARAHEFTDVVRRLWTSWAPGYRDAPIDGFVDADRIDDVHFRGDHIDIDGWLDLPPSAQGSPVIFQAGSSEAGIAFAGRYADAVFGITPTKRGAHAARRRLRDAAAAEGRNPDDIRYLPGARIFVDRNGSRSGVDPTAGRMAIERILGVRLDGVGLHDPIPAAVVALRERVDANAATIAGTTSAFWDLVAEPGATLYDLIEAHYVSSGFLALSGSPEHIHDTMVDWLTTGAADGFVIGAGGYIDRFYSEVLPLLRASGHFRTRYSSTTLRGHLGLAQ